MMSISNDTSVSYREDEHPSTKTLISNMSSNIGINRDGIMWKQLRALLQKSWIIRRVHYISSLFELLGPILFVLLACLAFSNINQGNHPSNNTNTTDSGRKPATIYKRPAYTIEFNHQDHGYNRTLYYASKEGNDGDVHEILSAFKDMGVAIQRFGDLKLLEEAVKLRQNSTEFLAQNLVAVYFESLNNMGQIKYRLIIGAQEYFMQMYKQDFPVKSYPGPYFFTDDYGKFVTMSSYINRGYLLWLCQKYNKQCDQFRDMKLEMYRMPYPSYVESKFTEVSAQDFFGIVVVICYVLICPLIVKRICDEKSTKAKELLSMMGMSNSMYYLSHYLSYIIILIVQALVITILLHFFEVIIYTNIILIFLGLVLFVSQLILFSMLIATIISRPVLAVIVTVILWIAATALIFVNLNPAVKFSATVNVEKKNLSRYMSALTPFGSIQWVFSIAGSYETYQTSLGFNNIARPTPKYGTLTILNVLLTMLASHVLYILLIWYLDNVWPFQVGVPKSPVFFLKPSYWRGAKSSMSLDERTHSEQDVDTVFEAEPKDLNKEIRVTRLHKIFRGTLGLGVTKVAVNDLSFNIYEHQISVLLGHNGAGKSTTLNMITGMYNATAGSVHVDGYNVFTHTQEARQSIGLCPQENIFFNELTVYQHLRLFALLKNMSISEVDIEIDKVLGSLQLSDKKNTLAINLSGGMKRKLQLGMALIGKTKILILDEPTSGMDPEARRVIWDLLQRIGRERTILLTTHFMEEADILGDRIIIMNHGKVCCSGSSLFLKNAYGTGYMLRISKLDGFSSSQFLNVIHKYVPTAILSLEMETEALYQLETVRSENFTSNMSKLFNDMEGNKAHYRIDTYGMSYTTLEDVFLTVGADLNVEQTNGMTDTVDNSIVKFTGNSDMLTGTPLLLAQCYGLFLKRLYFSIRYWPMFIFQILVPTLIVIGAMLLGAMIRNVDDDIKGGGFDDGRLLDIKSIYGADTKPFVYGGEQYHKAYAIVNKERAEADVHYFPTTLDDNSDINKYLLDKANNLQTYISHYIYGAGYKSDKPNVYQLWSNDEQYHSQPLSAIAHFEALIATVLPERANDIAINVVLTPIRATYGDGNHDKEDKSQKVFLALTTWVVTCLVMLPIAFPFLAASYILFPVLEQSSKAKLVQLMTGLSPVTFWAMNFVFDLLQHLLAILVLYLVIFLFDTDHIFFNTNGSNSSSVALFFLLLSFGVATIPLSYLLSYYFRTPSSGFVVMVVIFIITGLIANIAMSVVHTMSSLAGMPIMSEGVEQLVLAIFRLFPIFSFLFGYQKVYLLSQVSTICKLIPLDDFCQMDKKRMMPILVGCCPNICEDRCYDGKNTFALSSFGCGVEVLYLFAVGITFFVLIIFGEVFRHQILKFTSMFNISALRKRKGNIATNDSNTSTDNLLGEDEDVRREAQRVEQEVVSGRVTDLLTVDKLHKKFGNFTAVDGVSFGVHYDELFGLLGVNGAGKTTLFSMLTADLISTTGNAYMKEGSLALNAQTRHFQKNIGYCPQFDALINNLTGREMLYLFARLRGVPAQNLDRDVSNLILMVGLEDHAERRVEGYSGGNRRKLSIAMAMVGNPCLLFLDEPTSGVDPAARRKIWETLRYIKKNFRTSIVLTSHSMEECEALCARIAIMVNGQFRCLGSTQHLRSKYGQGYYIMIRMKHADATNQELVKSVQECIQREFPSARLKDFHQGLMHFHVLDPNETWSNLFTRMDEINKKFNFEDYVVSGTTLEQIFITFARAQKNANLPQK